MPIFEVTPQTIAENEVTLLDREYTLLVKRLMRSFDNFWNNPEGFTPQQMADAFGTRCLSVFQRYSAFVAAVVAVDANALPPEYLATPRQWQPELDQNNNLFLGGLQGATSKILMKSYKNTM